MGENDSKNQREHATPVRIEEGKAVGVKPVMVVAPSDRPKPSNIPASPAHATTNGTPAPSGAEKPQPSPADTPSRGGDGSSPPA